MSTPTALLFEESPLYHRRPERWVYTIDTTSEGGSPSVVSVKLYDVTADMLAVGTDVSGTKLSGSHGVAGNIITLPTVIDIEPGKRYKLESVYEAGGQRRAPIAYIYGVY